MFIFGHISHRSPPINKRNKISTEMDDAFIDRPTGCDFYKILGIPRTATVAQINAAYNLAKARVRDGKINIDNSY